MALDETSPSDTSDLIDFSTSVFFADADVAASRMGIVIREQKRATAAIDRIHVT